MWRKGIFLGMCLVFQICVAQNWEADFSKAQERTQLEEKSLLLVFSGSDWCAPCMKLERNIWKSEVFKKYASKELILYRADFPKKKKNRLPESILNSNKLLAEKYNSRGYFPLVVLLDPEGKRLGQIGYERISPEQYVEKIRALHP